VPTLKPRQLLERIVDRGPEPVYLVHGREGWFADRAVELLKEALFAGPDGAAARSFNYDAFAGREAKAESLANAARTAPMFAPRRLVVVREASKVPEKEWKAFCTYFDDPVPTTTIFVDWGDRKPDGRLRWVKACAKHGLVAESRPLYDSEIPDFLRFMSRRVGKELAPDAATALADVVGPDLHALSDALQRLALYVGDERTIRQDDVDEAVADTRSHEVWDLTDAVVNRDLPGALRILGKVRDQGAAAVQLLFHLQRTVRQLWLAKAAVAEGAGRDAVAAALGVHPFVAGRLADASRSFRTDDLADAILALADAEVDSRSGGLSGPVKEWVVMESLVGRLCGRQGA